MDKIHSNFFATALCAAFLFVVSLGAFGQTITINDVSAVNDNEVLIGGTTTDIADGTLLYSYYGTTNDEYSFSMGNAAETNGGVFQINVTALQPGTNYYFQVRDDASGARSNIYEFQTTGTGSTTYTVTTGSHNVSFEIVTLFGTVTPYSSGTIDKVGFIYATDPSMLEMMVQQITIENTMPGNFIEGYVYNEYDGEFKAQLDNLMSDADYYYQACVRSQENGEHWIVANSYESFRTEGSTSNSLLQSGDYNNHGYVDLGLSVKWATTNLGATNPEDYGNYYAWGETTPKSTYSWMTYQHCLEDEYLLTKYCFDMSYGADGFTDGLNTLEAVDDAATANWGAGWRMPTRNEMEELRNSCTWEWTSQNGIDGYIARNESTGYSMFLPAAGYLDESGEHSITYDGDYWTSSLSADNTVNAYSILFYDGTQQLYSDMERDYGLPIRAVYDATLATPRVTTKASDNVTETTAILQGSYNNDIEIPEAFSFGFLYGTDTTATLDEVSATFDGNTYYIAEVTGLSSGTTYYFKFFAENSNGRGYGQFWEFQTGGNIVNWITIGGGPGNNTNLPVNIYYKYSLSQQIYTPAEIGRAGTIERIAFYNNTDNIARTIDLYMFTSDRQSFTSTTDWETVSSSDRVFSGEVTFLSGEWTEIPLTNPFEYDGAHNIIIVTDDNTAYDATTQRFLTFEASGQSIYVNGDDTDFNPTDLSGTTAIGLEDVKNQIKLGFTSTNPTFEYVDLGLPSGTKWATMNIGAERPEDFGTYFAWGETSPKTVYDWESYIYADGDSDSDPQLTKYCNDSGLGITDALTELETGDDAATAILGSNWRMPTYDEIDELRTYCTYNFTTQRGVAGTLVTGPNNQSIFIPAAAGRYYNNLILSEGTGSYWSSSLDTDNPSNAQGLSLGSDGFGTITSPRYFGLPIRPVYDPSQTAGNFTPASLEDYEFTTGTDGTAYSPSLTQLIQSGQDDQASELTEIGFTFTYDEVEYTQFSANSNGRMRLGNEVITDAYNNPFTQDNYDQNTPAIVGVGRDLSTGADGYVSTGLYGSSGSYIRVVEFLLATTSTTTSDEYIKFQVQLFEATGEVRIVYSDYENAPTAYQIGIGNADATKFWYVDPNSHTAAYATESTETSYSGHPGIGRYYSFAPPVRNNNSNTTDHEYVDLGLPSGTKWATMNIGAESPEDFGSYFAWGETSPMSSYNLESYTYANGYSEDDPQLTKYCNNASLGYNGYTDNLTVLEDPDDAAIVNWGNGWRMPTYAEVVELRDYCQHEFTTQNGVAGTLVTGPNNRSIFIPAAGGRVWESSTDEGEGSYWANSLSTSSPIDAQGFHFEDNSTYAFTAHSARRYYGYPIRPVYATSQTANNQIGSFTDTRDGRTYDYVVIGDQTWMAENLRYDNSGSMTVALSGEQSTTDQYLYYPNGLSENLETYGYLYNWPAAMNSESSSESNPSGVQGICPDGWHLPSNAEWTQLYQALGGETNAGAMLSGNASLWSNPTITESQYFGNSGFNALPAGYYESNDYGNFGNKAFFWSASEYDTESAYICYIGGEEVGNVGYGESAGLSVRCVKNGGNTANNNTNENSGDIIYQCDFENGSEDNWPEFNNGSETNHWTIGFGTSDASTTDTHSLYITNDGSSYNYNNGAASTVYAYKEITLPSRTNYHILFDWKCTGENNYDFLRAFLIPTSENPDLSAGNSLGDGYENANNTPDGWIDLYYGQMESSDNQWQQADRTMALNGGNYYLVFYWHNDGSAGSNPPAAVDNIFFYKLKPISVTANNVTDKTSTSATLNGTITFIDDPEDIPAGFKWGLSETSLLDNLTTQSTGETFSAQLTGLTAQTTYYYQAYAVYEGDTAFSEIAEFRTALDEYAAGGANNPLTIGDINEWQDFTEALGSYTIGTTYKDVVLYDYGQDIYFSLVSNLSFTDAGTTFTTQEFRGNLNGNNHTITIEPNQNFTGIFSTIYYGHIDNLNLRINSSVTLEDASMFGVLCQKSYEASISNCTVSGVSSDVVLTSNDYEKPVGGLVGYATQTTISGCTNNLKITSDVARVGGIAGKADGTIMYCTNNAELSGSYVGGIVAESAATITDCLNTGLINCADEYAGGISAAGGTIVGCMNIGEISTSRTQKAGGIIGNAESATVTNCANYGVFTSLSSPMGGIAGTGYGRGTYSDNVSAPIFRGDEAPSVDLNTEIYATVGGSTGDETDDFFDEQLGDIKVDSLRLRFIERGTRKTSNEMVGSALSTSLSSEYWDFTEGVYPKPKNITETPQTLAARIPIYLSTHEYYGRQQSVFGVWSDFLLPTTIDGQTVTWESSNTDRISISNGSATVNRPTSGDEIVTLTASYQGYSKWFTVTVIGPKQIPVNTDDAWQDSVISLNASFSDDLEGITYVYDYGFQYSTTSSDLSEDVTQVHSNNFYYEGTIGFSYPLAGIPNGTTVYYRAYATTADGTEYGEIKSHKALGAPVVVAKYPMWRTDNSATIDLDITLNEGEYDDFYQFENRNVYYGTARTNLNLSEYIDYESDFGRFYVYLSDLEPNTKYYYVAEVANDYGTTRSDTLDFITCGTMTDSRDNTQYYTIQIGNQTWMAQNLKFDGVTAGTDTSSFVAYRYNPDDFDGYVEDYGYLYNWTAILNGGNSSTENPSGVQGICPNGWHLPSDAEWTQLTTYLGGGDEVAAMLSGHPASEGQYWEITDMTESVNFGKSGFNAMPTGVYYAGYYEFGKQTAFWSVTESDDIHIYSRYIMGYGEGSISRSENEGPNGYAVRCVKGTAVYAYDTINPCMEQPYSYTYHDTVITTDGDYTIREQIDSDTENIYKLHIAFHPTLTATVSEFSNGCFGANNGYVEVGATGGAGNYSYAWSTPEMQTSNRLENLAAGEYAVTVTDVGGCTASVSQAIVTPGQLTVTISGDNQICEGDNASLTATVEGGTPDYSYAWTNGATNESTNVQTSGTYAVTVTDDASCTATAAIVVTVNPAATLELTSGQQNQTLCYGTNFTTTVFTYGGGANGVDVTGLPNGVSFTTDATNHTVEISGTPTEAGSYTYMVTTTGATSPCTNMTITGTIIVQMQLTATISGNNPDCYGDETTLTTSADGGTPNYTYAWNTNQTTESIAVTPTETTTYTITITDANGCTASASKNVVVNSQLTVSISGDTQVQCFGDNTATLTANASGGSMATGYTYNWSNSLEGQTISTLGAGNYSVTATDANGCVATASVTITQPSVALSVIISATNTTLTCSNLSSTLTATPTGGTEDYTYSWSNSGSNNTTEVTTPGSYIVEVTDANGCTAEATQAITQDITQPTVTIDNTETELNCNQTSIALTATGSDASYVWSNGETNATTTVTTPATYAVTATGSNGCTSETSVAITKVENPTVEVTAGEILCNGATTTFTANVSNGRAPYTFRWQDNSSNQTLTAQAGTYNVTITDSNGCTASAIGTASVNDQTAPELTGTWPSNITGQNNCFANADISGLFSDDAVEALYEDCSGLTVSHSDANTSTDNAGWTVTRTYTIQDTYGNAVTPNPTMSVSGSDQSAPELSGTWPANITGQNNCFANADISGFMDDDDVVALYSDCGTVTVSHSDANTTTDNCGWTITRTFTISDGINSVTNTQSISGSDQSVPTLTGTWPSNITAQNNCFANADLSGLISDDNVAALYSDGCGGTVTVNHSDANTLTDNCGWTITRTYTITNACGTNSTTMTQSVSGSDQTAPVLSGTWSANITAQNNCFADADISGLMGDDDVAELYSDGCGGTISVTHTDANTTTDNCGWTITRTYTISDVCGNEVTNTQSVSGSDQSAPTIGDDNLNRQLTSTNCTFIVPDLTSEVRNIASDNCTANGDLTVSQNITAGTEITATTTVTVTVTDQCGNNSTKEIELTLPTVLTTSLSANPATIACNGGTTSITNTPDGGTAPYQYFWSNSTNEQNLEDVSADIYTVTVRDNNGCSVVESIEITQPNALTASLSAGTISCYGETVNVTNTVDGGTTPYAYAWGYNNATSQNLEGVSGGTYKVTVTDTNGCTASATITVNEPEQLTSSLSAGEIGCNGGIANITNTVTGGTEPITYEWSNGANTQSLTGVVAGEYTVTVRDNNGCSVVQSATISQPDALTASLTAGTINCNGETTDITCAVNGGTQNYTYAWSNGETTNNLTGVGAGTYSVTVSDANSCTASAITTVSEPDVLTVSISGPTSVCENTTTTLTANVQGGTTDYTYLWNYNNSTTVSITTPQLTTATEYSVTVTDANNCTASESVNVEIGDTPGITIADVTPICVGGNTMLQANVSNAGTGYTVEWSSTDTGAGLPADITTDAITVAPTSAGTYTYTVSLTATSCSDGQPFTSSDNVQLLVNGLPDAAITNNTNETTITCSTTQISLTATGGTAYQWSNGGAIADNNITSADTYTVTVTDANGCSNTESIVITEDVAAPTVNIINETGTTLLTCTTTTINVEATGTGTSYLWSNEVTTATNAITTGGTYTVTATADNGCTSTAAIEITPNADAPTVSITNNSDTTVLTCSLTSINVTATGSGTSYQWSNGANTAENTLTAPGTYTVTATAGNGCSASEQIIITQDIAAPEIIASATDSTICQGASTTISATGGNSYTWSPETGLPTTVGASITATPTATTTYTVTGVGTNGCNGTAEVIVTVNLPTSSEFSDTACDSYTWNGQTYLETGNFTQTFTNANGCDSVVTLHLTINNAVTNEFSETACSSFEWNSTAYTESGDYVQTLQTVNGCDSVVTLHLTINTPTENNDTIVACNSYEWQGQTYLETGDYEMTLPEANANGCDSIMRLHLIINQSTTGIDRQEACESFTWIDGVTYTESTDSTDAPTFTLQNAEGCDSVVSLYLVVNYSTTSEVSAQMCSGVPYTYEGETFTEAGTYTVTLTNSVGCDSIVTLTITYASNCGGIVSGIITDENSGEPIYNARVTIGNKVTRTNADGEYSLEVLRGRKTFRVSATGYISQSRTVDIQSDTVFNISLNAPHIETDVDSLTVSSYPYLEQSDSITLSNTGSGTLVWSSITEYDNLALVEDSVIQQRRNTRSLWDSIQTFATRENAEQAIATDGFFIYTSSWMRPGEFNRYTPNGEYVETFYVENVGSIRNLSYDGTHFYGTEGTNIIFKLDLDNQTLVDSIETDIQEIRHCSFNKQDGSLLAGSWNSLYRIDIENGTSEQIRNDLANVYSSAFDNLSPGGPYLWLFSQTSQNNGPSAYIRQFNISTGEYTDRTHYLDDINLGSSSLAGGICASEYVCEGKFVLLADVQNPMGSNTIATYEIGRTNNVVRTGKKSGSIAPNSSENISVKASATETGDYSATIKYRAAVMGAYSRDIDVNISAVAPECDAVQQISIVTDTFHTVTLDWQPVELGNYESVSYLVFNTASQYAIDTVSGTTITYDGLSVGEHCFSVMALSQAGYTCLSEASDTVCAEIQDIPCNIPLAVEARSDGESITISWNMPVGVDYVSLYRNSDPIDEHITTTSYVDTNVVPETDYCYIVIAHFENGVCNEISGNACIRIAADVCTEAPVLTADAVSGSVALEWTESNGAVNYRVFRNDTFVGATNSTSYIDNVTESGEYCYRVESICEYGMYNSSDEVCISVDVAEDDGSGSGSGEGDAIEEWTADNLTLYPNPTYGQFFIEGQRIAVVQIFNASGMLVSEIENTEYERITINCEGWNPGLYNIRIISAEGETATRKVTIFR